jgi:hypothetical protein
MTTQNLKTMESQTASEWGPHPGLPTPYQGDGLRLPLEHPAA